MEEIFINPENGQVGKYSIKVNVFNKKNAENSLLSIEFYLDFFSKNSEIGVAPPNRSKALIGNFFTCSKAWYIRVLSSFLGFFWILNLL